MSGPVTASDASSVAETGHTQRSVVEITDSHEAVVGAFQVRRALPRRGRRTVGAWCFADHMGPADLTTDSPLIGPHPHMGLQTVTWIVEGELLHRDSLGSEQPIRPGQLNLMTAGRGVAHAEESTRQYEGSLHGIQLWVAQPDATRESAPAFEHHAELPALEAGDAVVTVLIGELPGATSTARHDTPLIGADVALRPGVATLPMRPDFEYALVVLDGAVSVDDQVVTPGHLGYLGDGRDEMRLSATQPTRALLLGGEPFAEPIVMWWNFVARDRTEMETAYDEWQAESSRFGVVQSSLSRIPAPAPYWR